LVLNWYCLKSLAGRCTGTHAVGVVVASGHISVVAPLTPGAVNIPGLQRGTHPALATMTPLPTSDNPGISW